MGSLIEVRTPTIRWYELKGDFCCNLADARRQGSGDDSEGRRVGVERSPGRRREVCMIEYIEEFEPQFELCMLPQTGDTCPFRKPGIEGCVGGSADGDKGKCPRRSSKGICELRRVRRG